MRFIFAAVLAFSCCACRAGSALAEPALIYIVADSSLSSVYADAVLLTGDSIPSQKVKGENKRLTAFIFTLLLGPFGVHRLYLGTRHTVPIAYVLTLGGGLGIVPIIDAFVILFTKDFEKLQNNNRFFMWSE